MKRSRLLVGCYLKFLSECCIKYTMNASFLFLVEASKSKERERESEREIHLSFVLFQNQIKK
jgi:hypothetical protein